MPTLAVAASILLCACGSTAVAPQAVTRAATPAPAVATERGRAHHFDVEVVASGLDRPTWVGAAPGDDEALWVLEQSGRVLRLAGGRRSTVLDVSDRIRVGSEQGLLGMAFDPGFARNGRFYLHMSDPRGDTLVRAYRRRSADDVEAGRVLLAVTQPAPNHNGGQLAFGPDGRLYLGLGDGGGSFDPRRTAQDSTSPLGKILAADLAEPGPRWETVLAGLRNPWRFSFDAAFGDLWIGDVGQNEMEEIDRVAVASGGAPRNLGWSAFEGTRRIAGHELDPSGRLVAPVAVYTHRDGCSVTGGVVYRGTRLPTLGGRYLYGDFCTGALWTLRPTSDRRADDVRRETARVPSLSHIGTDADGELVFASGTGGRVYRAIAPARDPRR